MGNASHSASPTSTNSWTSTPKAKTMARRRDLPPKFHRIKSSPYIYYRVDRVRKVSTELKTATFGELYGWLSRWQEQEKEAAQKAPIDFRSATDLYPDFLAFKKTERRGGRPLASSTF